MQSLPDLRLLPLVLLAAGAAHGATRDVAPGGLEAAIGAAAPGDELRLAPARFVDESATIDKELKLTGVAGRTVLAATRPIPNGKAILVVRAPLTIRGITFEGARVPDRNGAGLRLERGASLDVSDSSFVNNEDGILAADGVGKVRVRDCTFRGNGAGDGYSHAIYVNHIAMLEVDHSRFSGTRVGHHVKSRAAVTRITASSFDDAPGAAASYAVDLPNGGDATLSGNQFRKAADAPNAAIVHVGGEGTLQPGSIIRLTGNRFESARKNATALATTQGVRVEASGNRVSGVPALENR
jgi:nitrous oxidase accessory protein NosD